MGIARVLVIDDDRIICTSLTKLLSSKGYQVMTAEDGIKGMELMKKIRPEVALVDIVMPGMTGLELIKSAKASPELCTTQMIIISAHTTEPEIEEGFSAGAVDYITKPYISDEVVARVRAALRKRAMISEKQKQHQLEIFHKNIARIFMEIEYPMKNIVESMDNLKLKSMNTDYFQRMESADEFCIRLKVVMEKLQKIEDKYKNSEH